MGVTVHFRGKLKDEEAFVGLVSRIAEIAVAETLLTETFENSEVTLPRVREDERPWDYVGPTKGITLYLHEDCEPLRLEFDRDLHIQEWVKTQFAGVLTHVRLIKLLRDLQVFFESFNVNDEGEFWETGDENLLGKHMRQCAETIAEFAKKSPNAQVKVKEPDGRFTDLIT
jgi:hypothetical protein